MDADPFAAKCKLLLCAFLFVNIISSCNNPQKKQILTHQKNAIDSANKAQIAKTSSKKKKLYLTFDDGPNKGTKNVYRIINKEQVPATFFIIGAHVYGSKAQAQMYDSLQSCDWIELANHSYSHANGNRFNSFYQDADRVVDDFEQCADSLHFNSTIVRTPGRNIWRTDSITYTDLTRQTSVADSIKSAGLTIVGWDAEWHFDAKLNLTENANSMLHKIDSVLDNHLTKTKNEVVLLAHDQAFADSGDSTDLHQFIRQIKGRQDIELRFISQYPGVR
jgi:peptidoglycan-N-acetylglucosamine deacetylase